MDKKALLWIIATIVIILILIVVALRIFSSHPRNMQQSQTTFPTSSTTNAQNNSTSAEVLDFLHNGITQPDPSNPGQYYVHQSTMDCYGANCISTADAQPFNILYSEDNQSFTIALLDEPLGRVRNQAEQYLIKVLGLTESQMCHLHYYLGTTSYVNPTYGGENLGFSFCPGAVKLP